MCLQHDPRRAHVKLGGLDSWILSHGAVVSNEYAESCLSDSRRPTQCLRNVFSVLDE